MATLSDIKKQIASLEKQAAALLKEAASEAAKKAAALIKQHGLTAADVGLAPKPGKAATVKKAVAKGKPKPAAAKPAGVPKYRDPKSLKTWTGNGKAPGWIAGAKNRDKFLIAKAASATQVEPAPPATPVDVPAATKKVGKTAVAAVGSATAKVVGAKTAKTAAVALKRAAKKPAIKKTEAPVVVADASADGNNGTTPAAETN
jgi:DNA-binding protein H-NS